MVITFEELRQIKDKLPAGSMAKIAGELEMDVDTVRNYFGGDHYDQAASFSGVHFEKGIKGGVVEISDTKILECAKRILAEANN